MSDLLKIWHETFYFFFLIDKSHTILTIKDESIF